MTTSPDDTNPDAGGLPQPMGRIAAWWNRYIAYDEYADQPAAAPLSQDERTMRVGLAIYCVGMAAAAVAAFNLFLIAARGV